MIDDRYRQKRLSTSVPYALQADEPGDRTRGNLADLRARFIHTKLYRRQCTWWAYKKAKRFTSSFDTFLRLSKDDVFFETADFLNGGPLSAIQIPLDDLAAGGKVVYSADEIVFKEGASTLFDAAGNKIQSW